MTFKSDLLPACRVRVYCFFTSPPHLFVLLIVPEPPFFSPYLSRYICGSTSLR